MQAPPEQAVDEHHDRSHDQRRREQHIEAPGIIKAKWICRSRKRRAAR
jgi:hypothetical protein